MPFPDRIIEPATQVVDFLSDDFNSTLEQWDVVSGSPAVASSQLTIASGTVLLSKKSFEPPCLLEVVETMTARASTDSFRFGFYMDDNNLVEWGATSTASSNMDARMSAGGVASDQTGINVGASNNSYRLASIYVGLGETVWAYRNINSQVVRNEVYRYIEHGIPEGPFRIRLAGLAGTSTLKVHRVTAYQLADVIVPGALGHHVDGMAIPVRLTNTPFMATPSNAQLSIAQVSSSDTFSSLAAGSVGTGSSRYGYLEQCHVQAYVTGDQPFTAWLEAQVDGSNWQVIWYGTATDATTDAVQRYYAVSPIMQLLGSRNFRVKVKNNGASAGNFRANICFTSL
ncbi:MAG: hypothetical protein KatS3mg023_0589 [Armatimonadota bacterium]|nr:MAG: hypothetical protein KatS3mg023_0589 [Armatimonadota bacterium]